VATHKVKAARGGCSKVKAGQSGQSKAEAVQSRTDRFPDGVHGQKTKDVDIPATKAKYRRQGSQTVVSILL